MANSLQGIQRPYEDLPAKDAITYHSWFWDLIVYCHTGCWDHTLLLYAICSLQGYLGELVRSLGTDITLDDVLTILDEHYNNVKALDALNQELLQLCMGEKETIGLGMHLSRHLQILSGIIPRMFPSNHVAKLKHDHFYGGLPKWLTAMVAYLKASTNEKMYSDYLWAVREAEKEEAMEPSCSQTASNTGKPKVVSSFLLQKLKGIQPTRTPAVWVVHLEEEGTDKEGGTESEDPNDIEGVTEEFIVHLARAVKDAQQEEKHCYHCSSPEHFICECPLVKAFRTATHLNQKNGMAPEKGAQASQVKVAKPKVPQDGMPKA